MILCNEKYNNKYIALGNLPAVIDDFKNAKHTVKMMGILKENTFELKDVSHEELEKKMRWLSFRIIV